MAMTLERACVVLTNRGHRGAAWIPAGDYAFAWRDRVRSGELTADEAVVLAERYERFPVALGSRTGPATRAFILDLIDQLHKEASPDDEWLAATIDVDALCEVARECGEDGAL